MSGEAEETSILGGRVRLLQPARGYRVAMDPVLLAAAVPLGGPGRVTRVLDAGLGTGAAALCLLARASAEVRVTGLEIDAGMAALATRSAALNGMTERLPVSVGDLMDPPHAATSEPFDAVLTNPPYHESGTPPPNPGRAGAHAATVPLARWIGACLDRLRPKGRLVVIHRADCLDTLLAALAGRAGAAEILPLWPGPDRDGIARPARRVIVRARRDVRGAATLWPGLVLHTPDGGHTAAAERVLRHGEALDAAMAGQRAGPDGVVAG
ncbi:tRNA1(Val) (adenine(37)-N6)-methyltransferase [Rhodospira trueperi]|uniref:tRNA1(Val) A37 N6-methylase TrmN6 n=1 Tax=Rhodospira trueperi TaxID=69960 RepID=A0A1G7B4N4_9PROT|nr:methyltransferase domain-containing protein [Rhodospira trueperi]SDE22074.1 tRNA1(Val) A37 N6-methylase TrmN6 [Rhodospira trueperi]